MNPSVSRLHYLAIGVAIGAMTLSAGACGGSSDSPPAGGGPVSEADFQKGVVAESCARIGMCCSAAMQTFDEATCEQQLQAQMFPNAGGGGGGATGAGGAGGGASGPAVTYDAEAADKCLAEIEAKPKTCASLAPTGVVDGPTGGPVHYLDPCQAVYVGTKPIGDACTDSAECAPDEKGFAYCNPATQKCEKVVRIIKGQCGDDGNGNFNVCVPEGGDGIHVVACENSNFCYAILHEGDPCITEFTDSKCDKGLTCVSTDGTNKGTCVGQPKAGEPCMNGACAEGAYCDGTNCVAQKADGADCTSGNECAAPDQCTGGKCQVPAGQLCTAGH
jgi:hypothetical protein